MAKRGSETIDENSEGVDEKPSTRPAKMTRSAAAIHALENEENVKLLKLIDNFRELGLQDEIELPQLVVVGDQSSGKSSLLEGMTGFSFPTGNTLCTRFATQITLRKAPEGEERMQYSIIPAQDTDEELKAKLKGFGKVMPGTEFNDAEIANIIDEAAVCLGLPASTVKGDALKNLPKRFANEVLKIELYGSHYPQLSVVDVPGLFHNPDEFQLKEDLGVIRTMIESYAQNKRTIILAVMDGRLELANQGVFDIARTADPDGKRTVGVITKCDAIEDGDENAASCFHPVIAKAKPQVMQIAQNKRARLFHGWYLVKNRSTKEIESGITLKDRNENEAKFFRTKAPWKSLKKDRLGVPALTAFLAGLLHHHIRAEFPQLLEDIRKSLTECSERLDELGVARSNSFQQRQYLNKIASAFERHVLDATTGNYSAEWKADDDRKLRMHAAEAKQQFAKSIAQRGHLHAFLQANGQVDKEYAVENVNGHATTSNGTSDGAGSSADVYEWIKKARKESRGAELPGSGINPAVLQNLFRQQAKPWKKISLDYTKEVHQSVGRYVDAALGDIVKDDNVRSRLQERINKAANVAQAAAVQRLESLLETEMSGILQTENNYYSENLDANRRARLMHRLTKQLGCSLGTIGSSLELIGNAAHLDNEEYSVNDCHDILNAYYKVARKRFVDYVIMDVAETHYLGNKGLVRFFNTEYVGGLCDRELEDIAGESARVIMDREAELERLEKLQKALELGEAI